MAIHDEELWSQSVKQESILFEECYLHQMEFVTDIVQVSSKI